MNINKLIINLNTTNNLIQKKYVSIKRKLNTYCNEPLIDKIVKGFKDINYNVKYEILNSANYGCPQKRERVIIIATKIGGLNLNYPIQTHSENGDDGKQKWISVKNAIDDLKYLEDNIEFSHIRTKHSNSIIEKMKNTNYERSLNPKYKEAYYKCHPNKPSLTVKENHGAVFVHYEQPRCMTARELARLQTFPDDFIFTGSKSDILVQIGNAIPCLLAEVIGKQILKTFQNNDIMK